MGCSPAEAVELIVQEDGNFFTVEMRSLKLHGSLRGGEQRIALVPSESPNAWRAAIAGVLSACLRPIPHPFGRNTANIGYRIFDQSIFFIKFERIENPYAVYAQGGIVGDEEMSDMGALN